MKLSSLLADVSAVQVHGATEIEVQRVRDDSRAIVAGDVFVAVRGRKFAFLRQPSVN